MLSIFWALPVFMSTPGHKRNLLKLLRGHLSVTESVVLAPDPGSIMGQIQRSEVQPIKMRCRFEMTAADAPSSHEFCVFEFP